MPMFNKQKVRRTKYKGKNGDEQHLVTLYPISSDVEKLLFEGVSPEEIVHLQTSLQSAS